MTDAATPVRLPSTEYKVTFADGAVSVVSVHPDESLEGSLSELLQEPRATPSEVTSVELLRAYSLEDEYDGLD